MMSCETRAVIGRLMHDPKALGMALELSQLSGTPPGEAALRGFIAGIALAEKLERRVAPYLEIAGLDLSRVDVTQLSNYLRLETVTVTGKGEKA